MKNKALNRKVIYLVLMAAALVPLYGLSAPSFLNKSGERSEGGWLTQLRDQHGLSQANLGEIDPASESMKLATLGMRGVAANLLWERANEYKKKEEWDNLRATLNQIAKLQPNFISVWQFQAWNLSYNVSVEFDNYEHRYHWVKKGIDFLQQGIRYNRNEPRLLWDLGWFFGHKFGRSDEYVQFRRKYRDDEDFHDSLEGQIDVEESRGWDDKPDNWLTAYQWFSQAQDVVDQKAVPIRGKNPLVFHSDSGKSLIRYADAIENEGIFGEKAQSAWERAGNRWNDYGKRDIPTSRGFKINLNAGEEWDEKIGALGREMESLAPGAREKIESQRLAQLTAAEKKLLAADRAELDAEDYEKVLQLDDRLRIKSEDIIDAIEDPDKKRRARKIAKDIIVANNYSTMIRRYRDVVNFVYWKTRCEVEQQDRAIEARKYLWDANEKYEEADLLGALEDYDKSWERWASIHNEFTVLAEDVTAEDLVEQIKRYRNLLGQLDRDFPPPNFPMLKLVANYPDEFGYTRDEAKVLMAEAEAQLASKQGAGIGDVPADEPNVTADDDPATDKPDAEDASGENGVVEDADEADAEDEAENANLLDLTPANGSATEADSSQTDAASNETSLLNAAVELYQQADLAGAKAKFEEGFRSLSLPEQPADADISSLVSQIRQYRILLGQLDESFPPADFPLGDFVKQYAEDFGYTSDEAAEMFSK